MRLSRYCSVRAALRLTLLVLGVALLAIFSAQANDAPKPGAAKPFRFAVYGDTRDGHDIHRKLVALIMSKDPALVLQTGDIVHSGSKDDLWKIYDDITGDMCKKIPVYPARGNHDVGGKGYEAHVTQPFTSGNKLYYAFDKENVHFIALAIDEVSDYSEKSAQYKWLVEDLKTARGRGKFIIVYFHVPPYSIGSHGSDENVRETLCPLFVQYGVTLVLNGHDHNYYRTVRDGITYIVTGGGGAPLYPCNVNKGVIPGDKYESVHHIVVCDVNGDTATVTALRFDGSTLDRFTVKAR
ncbi:MAG TPA: metallophosphoesterase [Chthonomonadaceae bacterium]|nr:metallophosphoesterase [Chthonomonadaceae bacterium]